MGIFRRRRRDDEGAGPGRPDPAAAPVVPDEALPFLGVEDAQHLRGLVRTAFAERGVEVSVHAGHVADDSGRQFGLWNVAASCHQDDRGRAAWPALVGTHVERVLASMDAPDPFADLSPEQAATRTYVRLYERDAIPRLDGFPHREFAPGLVEMLALDLPDTVAVYDDARAARLGGTDALRAHGLANLHRQPVEQLERLDLPDGGGAFQVLLGESVHTASRALLLPRLATELTGHESGRHGWLLCVPNRHQVAWHLVRDATVVPVVQAMARFAALGFGDAPGPLSPHLYWWDGGGYQQLSRLDDDGALSIVVGPEFQLVLEELTGGS
ncbi:hypothetical protein F9L07_04955 [Pimelobacter simplex]|uniref:Uncharacterized protein n=1 Tax=Nocardioides simplex TaxID=2045 RepID=A0A7J5DZ42_NOCSI|nr:hypothetical protein [Pimelobacter simplex]KAB2811259.1 hypothetical protein F9L07_04955 [Pimelobacter simplex]